MRLYAMHNLCALHIFVHCTKMCMQKSLALCHTTQCQGRKFRGTTHLPAAKRQTLTPLNARPRPALLASFLTLSCGKLRWEIQTASELKEAFSRRLPLSERKCNSGIRHHLSYIHLHSLCFIIFQRSLAVILKHGFKNCNTFLYLS